MVADTANKCPDWSAKTADDTYKAEDLDTCVNNIKPYLIYDDR